MQNHYDIRIQGKVQKVGFRFHTHLEATRYNLNGYVRNDIDGGVYIEIEGEDEDLKPFLEWCHSGPPHAVVEDIDLKKAPVVGYDRFSIRH
ncbi:MAG: acylphosphatase [Bacteroidota bacterium]